MKDKNKIYPYEKQLNFIRTIDESMDENLEELKKELQKANIDIKEVQNSLMNFIKDQNAKLLIERGKLFQQSFDKLNEKKMECEIPSDMVLAFRKNEANDSSEMLTGEELQKLTLLKKAKDKTLGKADEQSNKDS